jgi:hypothetical protein
MKFNERYFDELGNSAPVVAETVAKAEQVANIVRATAPVDSGEYVENVRVEVEHTQHRVVAKVIADTDHGMIVESRYGTMARALRAVGDG